MANKMSETRLFQLVSQIQTLAEGYVERKIVSGNRCDKPCSLHRKETQCLAAVLPWVPRDL